ncbi:MAG: HRDC domain-containing protein [Deltaproteobacteria bacterium]|uniref:HRDC domain-containing protein n=1 Tax=Candidatus Desulfacyla euxinica TaxID=2841693 RepID=A0A8J6MZJ9_9DELT|nr:HRDC domain-containing protein [Candidatus Desulfacyla euxinica]
MFKIITIPFNRIQKGFDDEVLNKFLLNKKVKSHRTEFFEDGGDKYWTLMVEYDPVLQKGSKKEEEHLDESQKMLLNRLKAWRKDKAGKDGVPVYIIGTNKEFADIVKEAPKSLEALKNIKGFGQNKISRHGKEIVEIVKGFFEKP